LARKFGWQVVFSDWWAERQCGKRLALATLQELKQMVDIIKVAISVVRASKSVDENISNAKPS